MYSILTIVINFCFSLQWVSAREFQIFGIDSKNALAHPVNLILFVYSSLSKVFFVHVKGGTCSLSALVFGLFMTLL